MRRLFLAVLVASLLTSGCATIGKAMIRSLLGIDDDEEPRSGTLESLQEQGYGFNNPNAEKRRNERRRARGLTTND